MKTDDVNIKSNIEYTVPEHEILLSFNSDDQAELFFYWWQEEGVLKFTKHYNKVKGVHENN